METTLAHSSAVASNERNFKGDNDALENNFARIIS